MPVSLGMLRESTLGAVRSFSLKSYAPLGVLLAVQALYLLLGLNLGSALGMATAGWLARWIAGPDAIAYPGFLQLLPLTFSYVESATFILIGAWAVPRVAASILGGDARLRVKDAFVPTFLAFALAFGLAFLWQILVPVLVRPVLGIVIRGGYELNLATWAVSVLVGYAITVIFAYVPIVAVQRPAPPLETLRSGVQRGLARFGLTFPMAVLFSLPALLLQLAVQVMGSTLANRTRPENIAYLLLAYAVLGSIGTYLLWSMATRLHRVAEAGR